MLVFLLITIILILIVVVFLLWYKYIQCRDELYAQNDMYNYYKNKVSMIEYHYRNYKEGKNPFTVLRVMGDIIQDYYLKLGSDRGDKYK